MKLQPITRTSTRSTFGLVPLTLVLIIGSCTTTDRIAPEDEPKAEISYTVNREAWKYLDRAQQALAKGELANAREDLDDMKARQKRFNPYEVALMWQTYAHLYAEEENLTGAADALENALVGETLPAGALVYTLYNLGNLQVAIERYEEATATFTRWLELAGDNATPQARFTVGVAFTQAKAYDLALEQAEFLVASTPEPDEAWLQLLVSVQFERGDMDAVEDVIKRMLVRFPRKVYWQQLAAIYSERKDEPKMLAVLELMHLQGLLTTDDELMRLAQMLMFHGVPTKAIVVLNTSLQQKRLKRDEKTLEALANSYLYARESDKATGVLGEAARLSDDGTLYLQLGRQQLRDGEWEEAAASVRKGIAKGGIKQLGDAYLLLGSIHFNAEQWSQALAAFAQAASYSEIRTTAARWQAATEQQIANTRTQVRSAVQ